MLQSRDAFIVFVTEGQSTFDHTVKEIQQKSFIANINGSTNIVPIEGERNYTSLNENQMPIH